MTGTLLWQWIVACLFSLNCIKSTHHYRDADRSSWIKAVDCSPCEGRNSAACLRVNVRQSVAFTGDIGYVDVAHIPAGARNIFIVEDEPSDNYLALRALRSRQSFHADWSIVDLADDQMVKTQLAGTWMFYRKFGQKEIITLMFPTNEPIRAMVLLRGHNPGVTVTYEYPTHSTCAAEEWDFHWQLGDWTSCRSTCGQGTTRQRYRCVDPITNINTPEKYCNHLTKPRALEKPCVSWSDCPPGWSTSSWSECSATCGRSFSYRDVQCARRHGADSSHVTKLVDSACLPKLAGPKPASTQICPRPMCPKVEWETGSWGECSITCGGGVQRRSVSCPGGQREACTWNPEPAAVRSCNSHECVNWVTLPWSQCAGPCGEGYRTREVACVNRNNELKPEYFCDVLDKPHDREDCDGERCSVSWESGSWSSCSKTCDVGKMERAVLCKRKDTKAVVDDGLCDPSSRPSGVDQCNQGPCSTGRSRNFGAADCFGKGPDEPMCERIPTIWCRVPTHAATCCHTCLRYRPAGGWP